MSPSNKREEEALSFFLLPFFSINSIDFSVEKATKNQTGADRSIVRQTKEVEIGHKLTVAWYEGEHSKCAENVNEMTRDYSSEGPGLGNGIMLPGVEQMVLAAGTAAVPSTAAGADMHRQAVPSTKASATFFAGYTHYSADYLDRMNILVRHLEAHITAVKEYQDAINSYQRARQSSEENKELTVPVFNAATLPPLPVMHEWTMDVLGTFFFLLLSQTPSSLESERLCTFAS